MQYSIYNAIFKIKYKRLTISIYMLICGAFIFVIILLDIINLCTNSKYNKLNK